MRFLKRAGKSSLRENVALFKLNDVITFKTENLSHPIYSQSQKSKRGH